MNRFAAWGCLMGVLAAAPHTAADESVVRAALQWTAEPSCTSAAGIQRAVDARLGRTTFDERDPDIVVRGTVEQQPAGTWLVRIELVDADGGVLGQRVVESPARKCTGLDDSIALVVALMVDIPKSELVQLRQELAQRKLEADQSAAKTAPPKPPAPRRLTLPEPPEPEGDTSFAARLEALIAFGLLPDPAPALGLGLSIEPAHFWAIELEAAVFAPQNFESDGAGVDFLAAGAALFLCPLRLGIGAGALYACAGQRVGAVHARGVDFDLNRGQTGLLYDVGARVRLSLPLWGSLRLESAVGAEVPLSRFRYFATRQDGSRIDLFRQSLVIAAAQAGVGLFFH